MGIEVRDADSGGAHEDREERQFQVVPSARRRTRFIIFDRGPTCATTKQWSGGGCVKKKGGR